MTNDCTMLRRVRSPCFGIVHTLIDCGWTQVRGRTIILPSFLGMSGLLQFLTKTQPLL